MALNLQIDVGSAVQRIQQVTQALDTLRQSLDIPQVAGIERLGKSLSSLSIPAGVTQTIQGLVTAMERLSNVADMSKVVSQLQLLGKLDMRGVAQNVQALSQALSQLRVPPGLDALVRTLQHISPAATQANQAIRTLQSGMQGMTIPPGLASIRGHLGGATQGFGLMGVAVRGAAALLTAFGAALSAASLARFVEESLEMVKAMDRFKATMGAVVGTSEEVGQSWDFVRGVAQKLGVDIQASTNAFGKMAIVARDSGLTLAETKTIFSGFATAFRAFGADSAATARGMEAVTQVISKGKVSLEEIRRQLGQTIPAFSTMARAMGVSTAEMEKMISKGAVGVSALVKTAEQFAKDYGAVADKMAQAWEGTVTGMMNSWKIASMSFGMGISQEMVPSINRLSQALSSVSFEVIMNGLGRIAGFIGSVFVNSIAFAVSVISTIGDAWAIAANASAMAFNVLGAGVQTVIEGFMVMGDGIRVVAEYLYNLLPAAVQNALQWLGGTLVQGLNMAADAVVYLWDQLKAFASWIGGGVFSVLSAAMQALGMSTTEAGQAMDEAAQKAKIWNDHLGDTAKGATEVASKTGKAAGATDDLGRAARSAAGGLNSTKSSVNSLDGTMGHAIGTANALAAALAKLANTPMPTGTTSYGDQIGGGMPGTTSYGDDLYAGSYAGGGIVGRPPGYARISRSAFVNARHFADGGLSDGGIPAVLHEGEAVVPLQNGGIPVTGGGFPSTAMAIAQETLISVRTVNQSVKDVQQTVINVGVMIHDDFEKQYGCLLRLEGISSQIVSRLGEISFSARAAASASAGGGGGGGGAFGGYAAQPGLGPGRLLTDAERSRLEMDTDSTGLSDRQLIQLADDYSKGAYYFHTGGMRSGMDKNQPGSGGGSGRSSIKLVFGGLSDIDPFADPGGGQHIWDSWDAGYGVGSNTMNTNPDSPDFGKFEDYTDAGSGGMFAMGTPSTSNEGLSFGPGGAAITVHPDEAIIPLPDGRAIPVKLQGNGGRPITLNLTMHVSAKDAQSFQQSQDQILRELSMKMQRALKNIGSGDDADDPTKKA